MQIPVIATAKLLELHYEIFQPFLPKSQDLIHWNIFQYEKSSYVCRMEQILLSVGIKKALKSLKQMYRF